MAHGYHNVNVKYNHNTGNVMHSSTEKEGSSQVSDDPDHIISQQCTVEIHMRPIPKPARHMDVIQLHHDQTGVEQDDQGVYTL